MKLSWFIVLLAGLLEVVWAVGMKYSEGFSKPLPTVVTIVGLIVSFILLLIATKDLPIGTVYAVWTGIGAIGTAIAGIVLFGESAGLLRIVCLLLIVAGIVGLHLVN